MFQTADAQKIKTHISCSVTFFRKSCRLWDNVGKYCTAGQATEGNIARRMRFTCRMTKVTNVHSEYVILIVFPQQQRLKERASMLGYTYIACIVTVMPGSRYANTNHQALKRQYRHGKNTMCGPWPFVERFILAEGFMQILWNRPSCHYFIKFKYRPMGGEKGTCWLKIKHWNSNTRYMIHMYMYNNGTNKCIQVRYNASHAKLAEHSL
jgi:hypothetical protein